MLLYLPTIHSEEKNWTIIYTANICLKNLSSESNWSVSAKMPFAIVSWLDKQAHNGRKPTPFLLYHYQCHNTPYLKFIRHWKSEFSFISTTHITCLLDLPLAVWHEAKTFFTLPILYSLPSSQICSLFFNDCFMLRGIENLMWYNH